MQKLARDDVAYLTKFKSMDEIPPTRTVEANLAMTLATGGKKKWNENFRTVYALSDAIQTRVLEEWTGRKLPEPSLPQHSKL